MSRQVELAHRPSVVERGQVAKAAKSPKLKVYRTPIGFHDAYVAAPSQKAALAAWGSDANLFARGVAEEVTDPALIEEPLAHPGTVVKRLRGTAAEQLAALPPDPPKRSRAAEPLPGAASVKPRRPAPPPPQPKPDRTLLDQAERALAQAERRHRAEREELAEREAELARQRRVLAEQQQTEAAALSDALDRARAAYEQALAAWRT